MILKALLKMSQVSQNDILTSREHNTWNPYVSGDEKATCTIRLSAKRKYLVSNAIYTTKSRITWQCKAHIVLLESY